MKSLLILASFLSFSLPAFAASLPVPNWSKDTVKFAEDKRPVDGALVELIFTKNPAGAFDVQKRTVLEGIKGEETIEFVAEALYCTSAIIEGSEDVICQKDMRPVDGALVVLWGIQDDRGYYHFTMRTELDNAFGPEVKTVTVSEGLSFVD